MARAGETRLGAKSGGKYKGVAPGASLLDGKVLNDKGQGDMSQVIAGMEWAVAEKADVANLSLGAYDSPEIDPAEEAINRLSAESKTLFVVAAGNNGAQGAGSISTPGSADAALTVGAVDKQDVLAPFSSIGPRLGDEAIKVIDTFALEAIRTKDLVGVLAALEATGRVLVVAPGRDEKLELSARNLPAVEVILVYDSNARLIARRGSIPLQ